MPRSSFAFPPGELPHPLLREIPGAVIKVIRSRSWSARTRLPEAEDVFSESCVEVWRCRQRFDPSQGSDAAARWVYRIVRRTAFRLARARACRMPRFSDLADRFAEELSSRHSGAADDPARRAELRDLCQWARSMQVGQSVRQRIAEKVFWQKLTVQEALALPDVFESRKQLMTAVRKVKAKFRARLHMP